MKARELIRILEHCCLDAQQDLDVVVEIKENWVGPTPAIGIKSAYSGFDWDSGRIILHTNLELSLHNPEILKTHNLLGEKRKQQ